MVMLSAQLKEKQGEHNATGIQEDFGSDAQIIRLFADEQYQHNRALGSQRASDDGKGAEIIFLRS